MGRIFVKNGTPLGTVSLCVSCCYGHNVEGYQESEMIQFCTYDRGMMIPFRVKTCSNHYDKGRPSWEDMEKLALPLQPKASYKTFGFVVKTETKKNENKE